MAVRGVPLSSSPLELRERLRTRTLDSAGLRRALLAIAPRERDGWVDALFGLEGIADDGPELPREAVGYLPCPVSLILAAIDLAGIGSDDHFVDLGSGVGRAAMLVHLLTGARTFGVEVQRQLVAEARALSARLERSDLEWLEGDGLEVRLGAPTVLFLYCPFSSATAARLLERVRTSPRAKPLRVCAVDLPLNEVPWLSELGEVDGLRVFRERLATSP